MNKIKILAETKEQWDIIKERLDTLPQVVAEQIESAESSFSITCNFAKRYSSNDKIYIPKELVTQITHWDEYIGVYCGEFFFKIPKSNFNYNYIFI